MMVDAIRQRTRSVDEGKGKNQAMQWIAPNRVETARIPKAGRKDRGESLVLRDG